MSSPADATAVTSELHASHEHHVVSVKLLVGVFVALMLLTFLTVAAIWVDLGALNIWVAMGIATIKATLVALYFMHLRWDRPFNLFTLVGSLFFVALFLGFCMRDSREYKHTLDVMSQPEIDARNAAIKARLADPVKEH